MALRNRETRFVRTNLHLVVCSCVVVTFACEAMPNGRIQAQNSILRSFRFRRARLAHVSGECSLFHFIAFKWPLVTADWVSVTFFFNQVSSAS